MLVAVVAAAWIGWTGKPARWIFFLILGLLPITIYASVTSNNYRSDAGVPSLNALQQAIDIAMSSVTAMVVCLMIYGLARLLRKLTRRKDPGEPASGAAPPS